MVTVRMFRDACVTVVAQCPDDFAKAVAQVALGLWDHDAQRAQCRLLLPSLEQWHGETARQARNVLRRYGAVS